MRRTIYVLGLTVLIGLGIGGRAVLAQMHGGTQEHGHDQAGTHGNMQGAMMATDQMMRNIDTMMTNVSSMMRDLNTMHAGMPNATQHDQVMTSMQGTFDQMRQLHGSLTDMMRDPNFSHDAQSMKGFQQACRNLEQMTSAFQSMTKNMTQALKRMTGGPTK
ncbi:MAG: hypothetical protein HYX76_01080 [Acidobacteria bacterium]|nr:hypothetical protein [Acidobacteriota bacterium]